MTCDKKGNMVPSGKCSSGRRGEPACGLVHCEPMPIDVLPPIIVEPDGKKFA